MLSAEEKLGLYSKNTLCDKPITYPPKVDLPKLSLI